MWCLAAAAAIQLALPHWAGFERFTPIFRHLLGVYDAHGNWLLAGIALAAWLLRGEPVVLGFVSAAGSRPWTLAAILFPLLCLGSLMIYHDHPLSMDESTALFQARAFAAGRLAGSLPPDLLDLLVPPYFQGGFYAVARPGGELSANYWPGFALLLAPFAALGVPWMLNPLLGALTLPALHRVTREATESDEAAGWAVMLTVASPVFLLSSISYYAMQAHLLCNVLYALLLLRPTVPRALAAGVIGSLALTLHQPVPHFLFALPFVAWLLWRRTPLPVLGALIAGYLPLALLLGLGWYAHLAGLTAQAAAAAPAAMPTGSLLDRVGNVVGLPSLVTIDARLAGLAKVWTWGAAGLLVLAAWGWMADRGRPAVRVLAASLATTFIGYFFFKVEHGHGWGFRYLHSAWFVLPLLAGAALAARADAQGRELAGMAAWALVLSLVVANGLRLLQVEGFIARHLEQVPPLTVRPASRELVFVNPDAGAYLLDLVQNDPFLRSPRIVMLMPRNESVEALVARRFPGYTRAMRGAWGESWTAPN